MNNTIGRRIAEFRRNKGLTQDDIANRLGVSAQAVSKWENDISYPDIALLSPLAAILDVTVDELLNAQKTEAVIRMVPEEERKNIDDLIFKIIINSDSGDKVRVNLPLPLIRVGLEIGMSMPQFNNNPSLQNINFEDILKMVEKGAIGKLVEIESADGAVIEIVVE